MKQYICEIIRVEHDKMSYQSYDNNQEHRDFLYINPNTFVGMCARRYHTIYCDKKFLNDKRGQLLIKEIFKPMATLKGGKGIVFI